MGLCACLQRPEESVGSAEAEEARVYELPDTVAGN